MQLDRDQFEHVLGVWPVAHLATVTSAGRPHVVPIVFGVVDGAIYSPVDGKTKRTGDLQRLRNVARNGSVSLLLDHYDADWRALWWLRIDAAADVVNVDSVAAAELNRIRTALRAKYPQYERVPLFHDGPALLRIRPQRHVVWSAESIDWRALAVPRSGT